MSSTRAVLADARARRAAIEDRLAMGDEQARCMACRARGILAGAVVLAAAAWGLAATMGGRK